MSKRSDPEQCRSVWPGAARHRPFRRL